MASEGWIKLHRCIRSNWVWNDKPFSRGQAFLDLLLMVNHEDKKIIFNGSLTEVKRGSCITSIRKLGDKWGWSNKKVKMFLDQLQSDQMITYESNTKRTLVTIEKYDLYQSKETPKEQQSFTEETQKHIKSTTEAYQKHTNKNDKEYIKNDKEVYIDLKFVDEVIEKVKLTQEQYNKLINKYDKEYVHKEILGLDNYIINGKGAKYKDHYRTLNTWLRTRKAPAPKEDRHYGFNG